jgi:hypothetical protein
MIVITTATTLVPKIITIVLGCYLLLSTSSARKPVS